MKQSFSGKIEGIESEEEMRLIDADYLLDVLLVHNWHGNNKNIVPYKDRKGYRQRDAEVREAIINAPNVAVVVDRKEKEVSLEEVTEYCNDRKIEMVGRDWLDSLNESLEKAVSIAKAYEKGLKAFNARLEELEHETELLEADMAEGVRGYAVTRKCFEVRVKKELLRDIICFMEQAITEGSAE